MNELTREEIEESVRIIAKKLRQWRAEDGLPPLSEEKKKEIEQGMIERLLASQSVQSTNSKK